VINSSLVIFFLPMVVVVERKRRRRRADKIAKRVQPINLKTIVVLQTKGGAVNSK
jgi:hypothetical protein